MVPHPPNYQPLPLTSWGGFKGRRRLSESPYIESIWEGVARQDGTHHTAADGTIDFTFQTRQNKRRLLLSGSTSKAQVTTFRAGDEVLTVRLRTGIHMPTFMSSKLTDTAIFLPNASKTHFWLQNTALAFPAFDNIETFIQHMAGLGLLRRDIIVEDTLAEKSRNRSISPRTIQRHFLASTGLTMNYIRQIKRAEQARGLLASGHTLASIAYEAEYSNPSHMTNAFKHFFGHTPSDMRSIISQVA